MHDTAVIQALCNQVEKVAIENGARSVLTVALEVPNSEHFKTEHMQETFDFFRSASPLLKNTNLEFRYSNALSDDEVILRDIELDLPDEEPE
jgi:Zn finger protein HypA/HybF involved in hydrogenase expression